MRKNQKYTKEEMVKAIEIWQESGLSQQKFCARERLPFHIFKYWYKKIKDEGSTPDSHVTKPFIPVKVSQPESIQSTVVVSSSVIKISYPNGVKVSCPIGISVQQLHALINL